MYKIIISGIGGQGILTLSKLIANAFIDKGYHCLVKASYGKSIRNSYIYTNIIVSENKIDNPYIDKANYVIFLHENKSIFKYTDDKTIFYINNFDLDKKVSNLIKFNPINILKKYEDKIFINTYSLGIFAKTTNLLHDDNIKKSFRIVFFDKDFSIINKNYKVYLEGKNNSVLSFSNT
jgi:Pyruvate/2-oxoacid:ferredoxin oxidoreductase gamma subunit